MSDQVLQDLANRQVALSDGISNLATGLGTSKDKSIHNRWEHTSRNSDHQTLAARYREDWVSQKVINIVPQDTTREWRSFESEDATEADEEFKIRSLFKEAFKWARLYGTSFLIIDVADGRTPEKPLNWNKLKPGCIRSLQVVDRTRITVIGQIDETPMSPEFGMPNTYQFVNSTIPIHKSRLIRFEGTELPIYEKQRNLWYSDSTLIPLMDIIDKFHTTAAAASQMCQEANIDVITVEGLGNILQNSKGTAAMLQRFTDWKSIKSVFGVSILDSTEVFDQKKIQLSGVKDLIWEYLKIVAASVGIPATRFLSASPDGMNATGESDLINYIELLQGYQKDVFDPRLDVLDSLMSIHYGIPREQFKYKWKCIFPESAGQKAERQKNEADGLAVLVTSGILSRESALEEAKACLLVSKDATVGEDPNKQPPGASNA
jgi:phage-related protein (TIGR01555 family)